MCQFFSTLKFHTSICTNRKFSMTFVVGVTIIRNITNLGYFCVNCDTVVFLLLLLDEDAEVNSASSKAFDF